MSDGEAMVAETSAAIGYATTTHSSGYADNNADATIDAGASKEGVSGDLVSLNASSTGGGLTDSIVASETDHAMANGSNSTVDAYSYGMDSIKEADQPMIPAHNTNEKFAGIENVSVDASQISSHDHSFNGNNDALANRSSVDGINENGNTSDDVQRLVSEHQLVDGSALSAEEERLWSIVRANSLDFNAWTALINETEQLNDIVKIGKVYDAFLAEFPLCYGYWKKYADHEARLGSMDKVFEVYERAVQGVTYSVDMWVNYFDFAISTYGDPDTVRRLFERGLAYVDSDYLSFSLWDKYIEYEYTQQQWSHLAAIYTRILQNPNQQLDRYFNSFKELVATHPLSEFRTAEEANAAAAASERSEIFGQQTEGEVHPNAMEQSAKPVSAELAEAEELEKYITVREEMYKKAKEFDSKIIGFETAIRRPYFHVFPLNVAELENWHYYLDFIESGGDFNKIVKLYERCLIACANYPEYWIRYVSFMEASGSLDLADNALARATQVFVKRQPEIHLFAARFHEQRGEIIEARAAYQLVHTEISPGLLEAIIKHANMEHRLGNLEDACSVYEQAIAIEKGKEQSQTLPFLFAQYSRFLSLAVDKMEKAREILDQALENYQLSKPLLEALIHLESVNPIPKRIDYLDSLVEKFIIANPDNPSAANFSEREELSSIFLEFLDLFGDRQAIKKADDRHAKLFLRHKSVLESKKRHADDFLVSDRSKLARSSGNSSATSVMGAYSSAQQWPAGYGLQPQAWLQVTQSQGQWPAGYAQQAGYGAYGTYGNSYAHTQVQPSVSQAATQTAAYGSYPSTYQSQAFPRQSYPQSSTAATLNPPQQPPSVPPQPYYGSY